MTKIVLLFEAIVWELCNKFFSYIFSFCKIKVAIIENVSVIIYASGIRLPDCSKLAINWKNDNDVTTFQKFIKFFWPYSISLVKFSYWPKFHVNITTGLTKIFAYKGLTRYLEIANTPVWVLPSILRLGQVRDTKFGPNVSNKLLLHAPKCQGYGFTVFELLRENQLWGGEITPPTQISVEFWLLVIIFFGKIFWKYL